MEDEHATTSPSADPAAPRPRPAGWSGPARGVAALLALPALLALAVTVYMSADFPPYHLLDEAAHLHMVSRIASGSLPRMGEAFDAGVLELALPERAPGAPPPRRGVERFYLLHPPGYHLLAAPWFALAGGDALGGLRWVRAAGGVVVLLVAIGVPLLLLGAVPWRAAPPLRRATGALVAILPLAMPGVIFTATFVTNHQLDVVGGTVLGIASAAALATVGIARTRWVFAAAVAAGLLAATRLNDAWAAPIPLVLALLAPAAERRRDLVAAVAGLAPGGLILVYWLAWNVSTSGSPLPRQLAQVLTLPLTGVAGEETSRLQPLLLAGQLALGQCTPPRAFDGLLGAGLWFALPAWWLSGRRTLSRAALAAMALATWSLVANLGLLLASVGQPNGRYLLPTLCFAFAIAGASFAAGTHPPSRAGAEGEGGEAGAAGRSAALAVAALSVVISTWLPPSRLTPPGWGVPQRFPSHTALASLFGLPQPPPPAPRRPMVVDGQDVTPPAMRSPTSPPR